MSIKIPQADPIQTHHIHPPIPVRQYDWCAYRDPERLTGYGATEKEAIADLLEEERREAEELLDSLESQPGCPYCRSGWSHTSQLCKRYGGEG